MRRYLVVANQTLGGEQLTDAIKARLAAGPCHFHVLVPATRAHDLYRTVLAAYEGELPDDDAAATQARNRLDGELACLRGAGADVDGEIGDPHPMVAIRDVINRQHFDEVIVSTLPAHLSEWLRMDLPAKVAHTFALRVTHVSGPPPTPGDERGRQ
jgi:hypothetical protein